MRRAITEADLAAVVVAWLVDYGYDVYQEVELVPRGIRADIVARRGIELTIVETKTSASMALLGQVMERRRFAHRVYAAAPHCSGPFGDACKELGVGAWSVHVGSSEMCSGVPIDPSRIVEVCAPRRLTSHRLKLVDKLRPEHKTACAAGSPSGGHWSRYRDTVAQLARVVAANPGIAFAQALQPGLMNHHYSSARSARSALSRDIEMGKIAGVRIERGALWPVVEAREVGAGKVGGE